MGGLKFKKITLEGFSHYLISKNGIVKNAKTDKILSIFNRNPDLNGYPCIVLSSGNRVTQRIFSLHRLLALAWLPNPKCLPQINHKDGNKLNYALNNLEWCDNSHNQKHAYKMGLQKIVKGDKHHTSKLKNLEVMEIRWILKNTSLSQYEIAKIYGVHRSTILNIHLGNAWKSITGIRKPRKVKGHPLSQQ